MADVKWIPGASGSRYVNRTKTVSEKYNELQLTKERTTSLLDYPYSV